MADQPPIDYSTTDPFTGLPRTQVNPAPQAPKSGGGKPKGQATSSPAGDRPGGNPKAPKKSAPAKKSTANGKGGKQVDASDGYTAREWAIALLKRLGAPTSGANINAIMAWERAEGGHWENTAQYNPLNTTQSMHGDAGAMNTAGVRVFTSWNQGLDATVRTLQNGRYGPILAALKAGHSPGAVLNAVVASPWSSYPHGISLNGVQTYGANPQGHGGGTPAIDTSSASGPIFDESTLEKQYGSIAVALGDTELQHLVQQAVNQGWDDDTFQGKLLDTKFFKKHTDDQRNWLLLQATDPQEAKHELNKQIAAVKQGASSLGVTLSPDEVQHIAQQSLLNGWADDQQKLQKAIGAHFQMKQAHASGVAGTLQDQFNQLAENYGIRVSDDTVARWIKRNFTGKMTADDVKAFFEQQALSMYPGLSDQIKQGMSVADVASTYRDSMAQILELDPNTINVFDPTVRKALQFQPDPTKPSELMPLWQFEQQVRKDPRWLNTQNAKQSVMDTGISILKDWGLA